MNLNLTLWHDVMYCVGVFVTCNIGGAVIRMAKRRAARLLVRPVAIHKASGDNDVPCESVVTSIVRPVRTGDGTLSAAKAEELADKGAWSDAVYDALLKDGYDEETLKARYDGTPFRRYLKKRAEALVMEPEALHERSQQEFEEIQRQIGCGATVRKPEDRPDEAEAPA